jgi:hypothetical protein
VPGSGVSFPPPPSAFSSPNAAPTTCAVKDRTRISPPAWGPPPLFAPRALTEAVPRSTPPPASMVNDASEAAGSGLEGAQCAIGLDRPAVQCHRADLGLDRDEAARGVAGELIGVHQIWMHVCRIGTGPLAVDRDIASSEQIDPRTLYPPFNAVIQGIKKTARGFRNAERFKTAIYFHGGGLDLDPHETR